MRRLLATLLTLVLILLLVSLGRWQLRRADEKRVLFDEFAAGSEATRTIDLKTAPLRRYQHVEADGRYDQTRQILIDNISDAAGRVGYFVITPFALRGGGWLLINRGWIPMGATRAERPSIGVSGEARQVRGRADHMPRAGIQMGALPVLAGTYPLVAQFPTHAAIERLLHETSWSGATELLLLDADQPDGYVRDWRAPGFAPLRHIGYALQWFALALTLAVIYVVTNLR